MIAAKTVKYTRNNQAMAFLTVEDLTGTVENKIGPNDIEEDYINRWNIPKNEKIDNDDNDDNDDKFNVMLTSM
jgi:DNA polymerase III alpha subunit